jgi:ABC-type sugar transport system substrate-binding protein
MRKTIAAFAALAFGAIAATSSVQAADKKFTIALIPGVTTDAFYITMHRGAQAAADALGDTLVFQGASEWNPVLQVPVVDAVIARHPDAIAIVQHPAEISYFGVVAAHAYLSGQSIPSKISTGYTVIDSSNVDNPQTKRFVYSE